MSTMRREQSPLSQAGFTLVTALFLVVVGALVSLYLVRMGSVQSSTTDLALNGSRAYMAARAGTEWAIHRTVAGTLACPTSSTFNLTEQDLAGFQINISCSRSSYSESGNTVIVTDITSTATLGSYGVSPDYVYRQVQVTVAQ